MNIDNTTLYSLEEIINNVPLPVIVRKPNWSNSFTFRVERIQNGVAYGTSFKNGIEHHRLLGFGQYTYKLFEQFYYVSSIHYNSIEELFSAKENELFNEVFLKSLYDVKFSNTDNGVYEQCETYLREFLKTYGVDLDNEDRMHVRDCLFKSPCCKKYSELLEQNLEFFTVERSYIPWDGKETKVAVILDTIVHASIQNSRPITRQYARILASRYYVLDSSKNNTSIENLYKTLLILISDKEFNAWIIDDASCFERIVKKTASRIRKCLVRDVDEQVLVSQLSTTAKFRDAVQKYPFILNNARAGEYSSFIDTSFIKVQEKQKLEKSVKNEATNSQPVPVPQQAASVISKPISTVQQPVTVGQQSAPAEQPAKAVRQTVPVAQVDNRTGLEQLLSRVKKSNLQKSTHFSDFWNSIEVELKENENFKNDLNVDYSCKSHDYDDDVMSLMY